MFTGYLLQEADGTWQAVLSSSREEHADAITVYNFEVEGDHTYFVSDGVGAEDSLWSHNVDCTGDARKAVRRIVRNRDAARGDVRSAYVAKYGEGAVAGSQVHHILPYELMNGTTNRDITNIIIRASKAGFNFSGHRNGVALTTHSGSHAAYSAQVAEHIRNGMAQARTPEQAKALLDNAIDYARAEAVPQHWPGG